MDPVAPLPAPAVAGQLGVTLVVLAAAVLHATWNAMAKSLRDQVAMFGLIGAAYAGCSAAVLPLAPPPAAPSWPWLAGSVLLHCVYVACLAWSYRIGDFNQVYPLARGAAPLLVAAVAAAALDEVPSPFQLAGILTVSGGVALLTLGTGARAAHPPVPSNRAALLAALATGTAIAGYTLLDGIGVRRAGGVAGYTAYLFLLEGAVLVAGTALLRRRALLAAARRHWRAGCLAGLLSVAAYGLVLWAQTRGALAAVAALRESSVIPAALIGALVFREPLGRRRLLASAVIAGGVVLLNL